jgi:hypothetical protein
VDIGSGRERGDHRNDRRGGSERAHWFGDSHRHETRWDFGWNTRIGVLHDPWTSWSIGMPIGGFGTLGGCGMEPWSAFSTGYAGPGWDATTVVIVEPRTYVYQPNLGADVWRLECSPCVGASVVGDRFTIRGFEDVPEAWGPAGVPERPCVDARLLSRVNPAYDVQPDFTAAVDAAVNGEYGTAIYTMRRAAEVNPAALVGPGSRAGQTAGANADMIQRVRYALGVFQNPPARVVSDADAQFMVGALSAALGDTDTADRALEDAVGAGDASASTALLRLAVRGERLDAAGPWMRGTPLR